MSAVRRRPTAAECTRPRFGPVPPPAPIRGFRSLRRHAKTRPVQGDFPLGTLRIPFGTALGRTANATCFRRERNRYMSDDDIFPFSPLRSFRTVQPAAVRGSVSSRLRSRRRLPPPSVPELVSRRRGKREKSDMQTPGCSRGRRHGAPVLWRPGYSRKARRHLPATKPRERTSVPHGGLLPAWGQERRVMR